MVDPHEATVRQMWLAGSILKEAAIMEAPVHLIFLALSVPSRHSRALQTAMT
jgi:hypothetical protein